MLLLDEMLPGSIAVQLSQAGCDTIAVGAEPGLRGLPDADVLEAAAQQGRILVTTSRISSRSATPGQLLAGGIPASSW